MKKNIMMRMAAVLLVSVLLSTSVIGGTFAKYTTTDSGSDTARVAKWGVVVDVTVDGAFKTNYDIKTATTDHNSQAIAKSVVSSTADRLLAPGTEGTLLKKASIKGSPEVAVNVEKIAELELTGWEVDGNYYCPLVINGIKGTDYASANEFKAAVEASLNFNENYQANEDLAQNNTVPWSWAFEGDDVKDTALGNEAANGTAPTVSFTYTITVTQID